VVKRGVTAIDVGWYLFGVAWTFYAFQIQYWPGITVDQGVAVTLLEAALVAGGILATLAGMGEGKEVWDLHPALIGRRVDLSKLSEAAAVRRLGRVRPPGPTGWRGGI